MPSVPSNKCARGPLLRVELLQFMCLFGFGNLKDKKGCDLACLCASSKALPSKWLQGAIFISIAISLRILC